MRLNSNIFLIAYAIFLVFGIGFVFISSDNGAINNLICAVSLASTSISLADLFYSKANIDKTERTQLVACYFVAKYKCNYYMKQIKAKYGKESEEMVSQLSEVFNNEEMEKLFSNNFPLEEKEKYLDKVKLTVEDDDLIKKISEFIDDILSLQAEDLDIVDEKVDNNTDENVTELLKVGEDNEKLNLYIANTIAIVGLSLLLIVLTWNNVFQQYISTINNVLTIFAFLTVVLNLLIKDNYRAKSLKELKDRKKELYEP